MGFENSAFHARRELEMNDEVLATCDDISRLVSKAGTMGGRELRGRELRNGGGGVRRQRGDKLNSIVFLDGIGHFEEDRRRLKEGRKEKRERERGHSIFLSFVRSSNFQVDI